jgi:hypothetical protein
MNELKDIVTNLELSKKLKEKGFPQEDGLFYWWIGKKKNYLEDKNWDGKPLSKYRAVTTEELLKELPEYIDNDEDTEKLDPFSLEISRSDWFYISYSSFDRILHTIKSSTMKFCDALGQMYIWLADNKLLKGK